MFILLSPERRERQMKWNFNAQAGLGLQQDYLKNWAPYITVKLKAEFKIGKGF